MKLLKNKYAIVFIIIVFITIGTLLYLEFATTDNNKEQEDTSIEKQVFLLETKKLGDFDSDYTLEKTTKIASDSEIQIRSEAYGKLTSLKVKEGQKVKKGELLASFQDTAGVIAISHKQAKVNLDQARTSYASQKLALDKSVFDAKLNLEKLSQQKSTLEKQTAQNLKQVKDSLQNSNLSDTESKSNLDLEKLAQTIKKLEYDYETQKTANSNTLQSFSNNLQKEVDSLNYLLQDIADFGDQLYIVTPRYTKNNRFDTYFGGKKASQKAIARQALKELISYRDLELKNLTNVSLENIDNYSKVIKKGYLLNTKFLQEVEKTFNNSISSVGTLSLNDIFSYEQKINTFQNQNSGQNTGFITLTNNITTFLNTYKQKEQSIQKQIELTQKDKQILENALASGELNAEVTYNKTLIKSEDALKNVELAIKNAKNLLSTAKQTKDITLRSLNNNIKQAQIGLEKANIDYAKLYIEAPIDGIISSVDIAEGQTYTQGNNLLTLVGDIKNELDVYLPANQLGKMQIGDTVGISYREKSLTGTIFSKSNLADNNLNYKVTISLPESIKLIGGIATVNFSLQSTKKLIPINSVTILHGNENKGRIYIYKDGKITQKIILLGKTFGNKIEFTSDLDKETAIIMNDVSNFDADKFILQLPEDKKIEKETEKISSSTGKTEDSISATGITD